MNNVQKKNGKKNRGKKIIIVTVIIVALVTAGAIFFRGYLTKKSQNTVTYTVKQEITQNIIDISGNIKAAQEQSFQAVGDGIVKKLYVKEGSRVTKGQLILQLDDESQQYALARHDYDMQQKKISGAQREVELMEKQRDVLLKNIDDRKIYARFDGIVAQLLVNEGDVVAAKDKMGVILDRSYLKASVEVVETDAAKLAKNQKVQFTFPAYTQEPPIEGRVVSYPAVGRITSRGATVVDAEVRIENPPDLILTGYSFTGKIKVDEDKSVLIVQRQAIGYEQGKAYAMVVGTDGVAIKTDVVVSPYGTNSVSILSGLKEGDVLKELTEIDASAFSNRRGPGGEPPMGGGPHD